MALQEMMLREPLGDMETILAGSSIYSSNSQKSKLSLRMLARTRKEEGAILRTQSD